MNCKSARDLLPLYVGKELSLDESQRVASHIAGCKACTVQHRELKELKSGLVSLRNVDRAEPALSILANRVVEHARGGHSILRARPVRLRPVLLAVVVTIAIAAAFLASDSAREFSKNARHAQDDGPSYTGGEIVRTASVEAETSIAAPILADDTRHPGTVVKLYTDNPDVLIIWLAD